MPSAKHNLTMDKATGLIVLLFDIASSRDVPFTNHSMYNVDIMDFSLSSLCVLVPIAYNAKCQ